MRMWKRLFRWPQYRANKVHMKQTRACWMVQLECRWSYWQYRMCIWLPVPMFKLGSLMNIDDKSGVGRKICHCARFLLISWPFFSYLRCCKGQHAKDNRPHIGENQTFLHASPLRKNSEFKFWLPTVRYIMIWPTVPSCHGDPDESTLQLDLGHGLGHHMAMDFIICGVTQPKMVVLPVR